MSCLSLNLGPLIQDNYYVCFGESLKILEVAPTETNIN